MEKHIEKLKEFIEKNDPTPQLKTLSKADENIKKDWEEFTGNREWQNIDSYEDIEHRVDYFERCVFTAPKDIRKRNTYKIDMLIAQYRVIRALRKWCQSIEKRISVTKSAFHKPTEEEVDQIITRIEKIIRAI